MEKYIPGSRPLLSRSGCIYNGTCDDIWILISSRPLLSRSGCIFSGKKITFGSIEWYKEEYPDISIIEYRADEQGETDNFIKELTVKIYYNEITKKHYNSYDDAIADCKREMERQYDKN